MENQVENNKKTWHEPAMQSLVISGGADPTMLELSVGAMS
jgi:hypothetical protein